MSVSSPNNVSLGAPGESDGATSTLKDAPLQEAISRILPREQPALFPRDICDRLSTGGLDLTIKKYKSPGSFKTMVHQTLATMLKQKTLRRHSAITPTKRRSHRYVGPGLSSFDKSRAENGNNTMTKEKQDRADNPDVDQVNSKSKNPPSYADTESCSPEQVSRRAAAPVIPASEHMAENPSIDGTQRLITGTTTSFHKHTLPPFRGTGFVSSTQVPGARTTVGGHEPGSENSQASKIWTQVTDVNKTERTQPQGSLVSPSPHRNPSSSSIAHSENTQVSKTAPENNGQVQSLTHRPESYNHQQVSVSSQQEVQDTQPRKSNLECSPIKQSSSTFRAGFGTPVTGTACDNLSKRVSRSGTDRDSLRTFSVPQSSSLSSNAGQSPNRYEAWQGRKSISETAPVLREKTLRSLPAGASYETHPADGHVTGFEPQGQVSQATQTAGTRVSRSLPTPIRVETTGISVKLNPMILSDIPLCSEQPTSFGSQNPPSFTAINPKKRSEVPSATSSTSPQTQEMELSGSSHGNAPRSILVQSSNAVTCKAGADKSPGLQAQADVMNHPRSDPQTPKCRPESGSMALQQGAVWGSRADMTQPLITLTETFKDSPKTVMSEQNRQNTSATNSIDMSDVNRFSKAPQTAALNPSKTLELTKAPESAKTTNSTVEIQAADRDRSAAELILVNEARKVRQRRQKCASDAQSFDKKRQNAQLLLDTLLAKMDLYMTELGELNTSLEKPRNQVTGLEKQIDALRQQSDKTREAVNKATLECQAHAESQKKADKEFASNNKELKRLLRELEIF